MRGLVPVTALIVLAGACLPSTNDFGQGEGRDAASQDVGGDGRGDAAPLGDGAMDGTRPDGGGADTGAPDTAVADTGRLDTGRSDTAVADSGAPDSRVSDTAVADSGASDTGVPDTGVTMMHPDLSLPSADGQSCSLVGWGSDCPSLEVCRIATPTGGRCEGCGPCGNLGDFCTNSTECDILFQCFRGRCTNLCTRGTYECGPIDHCVDVGHETYGVCWPVI